MPISQREFFTTKPVILEYTTIEFYHPAFGYLRFIKNQFFEKEIAGDIYQPASMEVTETEQDERGSVSYEIQLGRIGTQIKEFIKAVDAYPLGWMIPIESNLKFWLSDDLSEPYRPIVPLSIGNIVINGSSAAITLDTGNPRAKRVARIYKATDFPGTAVTV